jgi:hypothetical protein
MENAGVYTLAALGITTALSASAQTAIDDLGGMTAVTLEASFSYGSGGTSVAAVVQTSFDGGTTWRDIARFDFTTSTAVKVANLQASAAKSIASYSALGSEGVTDGVLADRLRCVVTSTGTYVNTTLSVRASVR